MDALLVMSKPSLCTCTYFPHLLLSTIAFLATSWFLLAVIFVYSTHVNREHKRLLLSFCRIYCKEQKRTVWRSLGRLSRICYKYNTIRKSLCFEKRINEQIVVTKSKGAVIYLKSSSPFLFCQWEYLYVTVQRKTACFLPHVIIYDIWRNLVFTLTCLCLEKVGFFLLPVQDLGVSGWGWLWVFLDISATWSGFSLNKKLNHASVFPAGLRLCKNSQFFFTSRKPVDSFPSPPRNIYIHNTAPPHEKAPLALQHTAFPRRCWEDCTPHCYLLSCVSFCLSVGCIAMKTALSQPV